MRVFHCASDLPAAAAACGTLGASRATIARAPVREAAGCEFATQHRQDSQISIRRHHARLAASATSAEPRTSIAEGSLCVEQAIQTPEGTESTMSPVQQESLILLEWPQVCRQVAAFTQTVMGAEQLLSAGLPLGSSQVPMIGFCMMRTPCRSLQF